MLNLHPHLTNYLNLLITFFHYILLITEIWADNFLSGDKIVINEN